MRIKFWKRKGVDLPEVIDDNPIMHPEDYELAETQDVSGMIEEWSRYYLSKLPVATCRATEASGVALDDGDISDYVPPDVPMQDGQQSYSTVAPESFDPTPNIPSAVVGFFLRNTFIGHQLAGMLAQHWLIGKCCWLPARDAVRKGFDFVNADDDDTKEVIRMMRKADKRYRLKKNLTQFVGFGKTFGIRIAIFKVDSDLPDYYEHPFNPDNVLEGSYKGISQVDPYWCVPELDGADLTDPANPHFYEPTWWVISGKRYHRSHLSIYREGDVPDILKPCYLYGGIPIPQKIMERVYAAERTANEAPELAMTKRTTTLKTNVDEMLAAGPSSMAKLLNWVQFRNNYGVKLIGSDEELAQHDTSLNDFDALIMTQYQLVASTANVPSTKLLGTSPKGFGASGEYEIESYHEELESIQEDQLTEIVERHHLMVMLSEVAPKMQRAHKDWRIPDLEISWKPLSTPTAEQLATINYTNSQTALNYVNAGALDGVDVRDNIIADPDSGYAGIPGAYRPGEEPSDDKVPAPMAPVESAY